MPRFPFKTFVSLLAIGVMSGLVGMLLTWLLHTTQHLAYDAAGQLQHVSFRELTEHATARHRLLVMLTCGVLAGAGWVALHRWGKPLLPVAAVVRRPLEAPLPFFKTMLHAVLQIVTVGLGSPLGREGAPREFSVALAWQWVRRVGCDASIARMLVACASGAGLAAVYNVPLAGAVFTLETLPVRRDVRTIAAALISCGVAVAVARLGLGDVTQYNLGGLKPEPILAVWAVLAGPVLALAADAFTRSLANLPWVPRSSARMLMASLVAFVLIGLLAGLWPEILGNGKAGNELSFAAALSWQGALSLFAAKWLAVALATAGGAWGGRITPSLMLGSMLALVLAHLWNLLLPAMPAVSPAAAALVGAAIFLALAQNMPLTALLLTLEMTQVSPSCLLAMCLCLGSALPVHQWLRRRRMTART